MKPRKRNTGHAYGLLFSVFAALYTAHAHAGSNSCPRPGDMADIHRQLTNGETQAYGYKSFNIKMPDSILDQQTRSLTGLDVAVLTQDGRVTFGKLEAAQNGTYRVLNSEDGLPMVFARHEINSVMGRRDFNKAQLKSAADSDLRVQLKVDGEIRQGKVGLFEDDRIVLELETKPARAVSLRFKDVTDVKIATNKVQARRVASKYAPHEVEAIGTFFNIEPALMSKIDELDDEVLDAVTGLQRQLAYVDNPKLRAKARAILMGALRRCGG